MSPLRRTILALLASLLVTLVAAPATASLDDQMSEKRAGKYYLRAGCAHTDAAERFQRNAIDKFNALDTWSQARRLLPALNREAGLFARAYYKMSRALMNPPAEWPESVSGLIDRTASGALKVHNSLRSASAATSAQGWYDHVISAGKASRSLPTARIRAKLDLPPPGRSC